MVSQDILKSIILPILDSKGLTYQKMANVLARKAKNKEKIITRTSDGIETINTANEGDYVVQNQTDAREEYLMDKQNFEKRYEKIRDNRGDEYAEYKSKGKIRAIEFNQKIMEQLGTAHEFYFEAPWKEQMVIKFGDFFVKPVDNQEVYRVAQKEFGETYQLLGS